MNFFEIKHTFSPEKKNGNLDHPRAMSEQDSDSVDWTYSRLTCPLDEQGNFVNPPENNRGNPLENYGLKEAPAGKPFRSPARSPPCSRYAFA